jgi:diguanylate cyclase (GGDEF)-like protein
VIFLDLDNFKQLNDLHGHKEGDLLLVEIARRLVNCVRAVDTVARFGGDEFVVVLRELEGDESQCTAHASIVTEKIHSALVEPYRRDFSLNGSAEKIIHQNIGASIGVALFDKNSNAESILNLADMAMYQAKEAGRNQIRFYNAQA